MQPWEPINKKPSAKGCGIRQQHLRGRCHIRISQEGWQRGVSFYATPVAKGGFTKGAFMVLEPPVPQGNCCSHLQIRTLLCNLRCGSVFGPHAWVVLLGSRECKIYGIREKSGKREAGWGPWMDSWLPSAVHNFSMQQPQADHEILRGRSRLYHMPSSPLPTHFFTFFHVPGSLPTQNGGTCQVQVAQDMTLF